MGKVLKLTKLLEVPESNTSASASATVPIPTDVGNDQSGSKGEVPAAASESDSFKEIVDKIKELLEA